MDIATLPESRLSSLCKEKYGHLVGRILPVAAILDTQIAASESRCEDVLVALSLFTSIRDDWTHFPHSYTRYLTLLNFAWAFKHNAALEDQWCTGMCVR